MEFKETEIKEAFIVEELDIYGEYLTDLLIESIEEKKLLNSGDLIESIHYSVDKAALRLRVSFLTYGRIHDLKSHNKSSVLFETPDTNALIWGIKKRKKRKNRRNKQWYSRNIYGSLNQIESRLMWGYSEEARKATIAQLKNIQSIKSTIS